MRAKSWVLVAAAAWMVSLAVPPAVRADLPIKPLEGKDLYTIGSDPWVPDDRNPGRIVAVPSQTDATVIESGRNVLLQQRALRAYLMWERILRLLRIGGVVR